MEYRLLCWERPNGSQKNSLCLEIVNHKHYCVPGKLAPSRIWKIDARKEIAGTFTFSSPIWTTQKADGSWRMAVDYHQLNQVVTVIAAVVPDMVSLLEQINTFF